MQMDSLPLKDPIPMFLQKHGSKHSSLLKTGVGLFPFLYCMVVNCKSYDLQFPYPGTFVVNLLTGIVLKFLFNVHFFTPTDFITWQVLGLQQSDETPMVWEMLLYIYVLYSPDWHYRSTMPTFLFLYGAAFAVVHSLVRFQIGFKVHYIILCLLCIPRMYKYYIQTKERAAKRLAKLYVATILLGTLCWLFDRIFCKKLSHWSINPQGHAWWHVLMGLNSYFANTFLMFCRAQQLGWQPRVVHLFGFFPYVKIQKPKKQE